MGYGEYYKIRWASSWTNSVRLALQTSLGSEDSPLKQVRPHPVSHVYRIG